MPFSTMSRIQISEGLQLVAALRGLSQQDEEEVEALELRPHRLLPTSV